MVNEVEDPDYWYHVARDGNRETHYRGARRHQGCRRHAKHALKH